jgi:peptide/nickel transport system substrate-binding protein
VAWLAPAATTSSHPCLVVTGVGDGSFARNFNPYGVPLDFTWGGIYEPLVVATGAGGGHTYDWLASRLAWSRDGRTLTLTVRSGVRWSDGKPLTARDVLYTLTAGRRVKLMDQIGLTRPGNHIASIELAGPDRVAIHFRERDSTFVESVLANDVFVVPEHVFSNVRNVAHWLNPNPVGTGPFTVVERFDSQSYVLGRNPRYWLDGAPHFACIQRITSGSNESAVLQLVHGDVDLTNDFVPNAQKAYVAHDPAHFHYFYPARTAPIGLFFDDTKYPFSLPALRQAISMAIDRELLAKEAEYGYSRPVDAIGIDRAWPGWSDADSAPEARRLATYDPAAARRTLTAAGFTYRQGTLEDPAGHPVVMHASVVAGWVDWLTCWQLIRHELEQVGIHVDLRLEPDFGAWMHEAFATRRATLLWTNAADSRTPYLYFRQHLDAAAFIPSGHDADRTGDWEHFQSAEGTRLLRAFRDTFDPVRQHELVARLGRLWLEQLPFVPLFSGPVWSTYSTRYFTGYPTASDYYLQPSFSTAAYAVALTRIRPRHG